MWSKQMSVAIAAAIVVSASALASAQVAAPRADTRSADRTGAASIRGRVIAAETGDGIRRAEIRITISVQGSQPFQQMTTTDAEGRYEFLKLPAGGYIVSASRRGYVTLQFGQRQPFEAGKTLNLGPEEAANDVSFALPRGGVIAGRVTDDLGEPVAGALIQAERTTFGPTGQTRILVGTFVRTDDLGEFRLYGLMPGSYLVTATPSLNMFEFTQGTNTPRGLPPAPDTEAFVRTYFPGTANSDEAQPIAVGLGEDAAASFPIVSARLARISGTVRTSDGKPLRPSFISLQTTTGSTMSGGSFQPIASDGTFVLPNVPPGEYTLVVVPRGPRFSPTPSQPDAADPEFAMMPLTVAGREIAGLTVTTVRGGTISGHVTFSGTPQRELNPPLRVTAYETERLSGQMSPETGSDGVIDPSGKFQIHGIIGKVLFRFSTPSWNIVSATINGVDAMDTPVDIKPGAALSGLEIFASDRQSHLTGFVTNAMGDRVKDYTVVVLPARVHEGFSGARYTRTVRPDQNGTFIIRGLPASDYVAVAVEGIQQGTEWDPAFQQQVRSMGKPFKLADGQDLALTLPLSQ
jgi:hypothetical protein